jgi:hypothetical protein
MLLVDLELCNLGHPHHDAASYDDAFGLCMTTSSVSGMDGSSCFTMKKQFVFSAWT